MMQLERWINFTTAFIAGIGVCVALSMALNGCGGDASDVSVTQNQNQGSDQQNDNSDNSVRCECSDGASSVDCCPQ